jgi:hypothetical protein
MANRRVSQMRARRITHTRKRMIGIIDQNVRSSSEGPDDSPVAQKAAKATKARRA